MKQIIREIIAAILLVSFCVLALVIGYTSDVRPNVFVALLLLMIFVTICMLLDALTDLDYEDKEVLQTVRYFAFSKKLGTKRGRRALRRIYEMIQFKRQGN